jgi:DNA-binding response OmpR family regulator
MTKILVIEDDDDLCSLVVMILEAEGYAVTTAANGIEGLARASDSTPDLILLDLKMPVMSGAEFAAEYRARFPDAYRVPIIVMTAASHAARRGQEIGATDFLGKPFSNDELVRIVAKHLPSHGQAASSR